MTNQSAQPTYFDVYDEDDTFLMRTTMRVMLRTLNCSGKDGPYNRIMSETSEPGGVCKIHLGKRNPIGLGTFVMVQLAIGPRANY